MRKANKAARTAFTSRRYRELMQNNRFECYKHLDPQPQSDVAICPHHHAFYEIIFVVQGDLFYEVEGRPYHLKRGDVILIDELQFHHGLIHHQQNYERYALWIHPKYMQMLSRRFPKLDPQYCFLQLNSDNNNVVHLDQHSFEELEQDLAHLFTSYWSKTPSDEVLSESYFAIIMTKLNQIVHRQHCAQLHAAAATAAAVAAAHAPIGQGTRAALQGTYVGPEAPNIIPTANVSSADSSHKAANADSAQSQNPTQAPVHSFDSVYTTDNAKIQPVDIATAAHDPNNKVFSSVFFHNTRTTTDTVKLTTNAQAGATDMAGSAHFSAPQVQALMSSNNEALQAQTAVTNTITSLAPAASLYEVVTQLHDPRDANDIFNADPKLSADNWELDWEYANGKYSAHYMDVTGQNRDEERDDVVEEVLGDDDTDLSVNAINTLPEAMASALATSAAAQGEHITASELKAELAAAAATDISSENAAEAAAEAATEAAANAAITDNIGVSNISDSTVIPAQLNSGYSVISSQLSTHQTPLDTSDLSAHKQGTTVADSQANEANAIALAAQDDGSKPAPIVTQSDESHYNYHLDDDMHLNLNLSERLKLSALLKYINLHINDNLSLDELAQRFSLSKFYLTRRFKELTGLSLHQFIVKKRLTKARYLISVGVDPYRAAVDAGFNNYSHFSRTFKSYFGQNPSSIPQAHTIHHNHGAEAQESSKTHVANQ